MKSLKKSTTKPKGFTLVELLLGMTLTILVGGVLYLLQSTGMSTVKKGTTQLLLTSEVRNNMELIAADLRNSKEIVEIRPDFLKIRTYKFSKENPEPGESALVTVIYELDNSGKRSILWRTQGRGNPIKLLSVEKVNEQIFYPYFEAPDKASPVGWSYYPFDMGENDSGQRKKISHVQIKLNFTQRSESAELVTTANLRAATSRIRQPEWKYR
ncbi:MAG: PilW family protein [Candidatus Rifleibacteriota bacterium]